MTNLNKISFKTQFNFVFIYDNLKLFHKKLNFIKGYCNK